MTDPRQEREGGKLTTPDSPPKQASRKQDSKTAGTNRDFDESGESVNQGHGHPREERGSGQE
jgi:hypothetical protein